MALFSRRTILTATDALVNRTHTAISRFLLEHGLEDKIGGDSKQSRATGLARYLINNPDETNEYGENISDGVITALVGEAIRAYSYREAFNYEQFQRSHPDLYRALERDGYTVESGALRGMLPRALGLPQADDDVHALLDQYSFTTTRGHLDQGMAAHDRGDWAAANAQFRAFIESLFDEIARNLGCPAAMATSGQRRTWLAQKSPPFFIPGLNEWDFQGGGFMEAFFRRLHPQGAHPGLSDEDDSTFRLHMVLIVSRQLLRRI